MGGAALELGIITNDSAAKTTADKSLFIVPSWIGASCATGQRTVALRDTDYPQR